MNIGYLAKELSSGHGTARYARSLIEAVSVEHEVLVLTAKDHRNETKIEKIHKVLSEPVFNPFSQIKNFFHSIVLLRHCDVVHILVEQYGPGAALACHLLGIPFTMTLHGTYAVPPKKLSLKKIMMRYLYWRIDFSTTGSLYTEQKVREVVPMGECRFIPNGVNLDKFYPMPEVKKKNNLLTVGMLKSRKGADLVVEALGLLKDRFPDLTYDIVGDQEDWYFLDKLKSRIKILGLEKHVTFHEHIDDTELLKLYNQAKVFILAARDESGHFEGFPMVFYEANACGIPVITTKGFGSEYAIKDGHNGYVVDQNDPQTIAQKVSEILSNTSLQKSMYDNGIEQAHKHTWDEIAKKLSTFYTDAIKIHAQR
ncbi:MAG: hypothetical protein A3H60_02005 [Candidatus Zambryskibacteria bacterium RIFCSPLOWO2_02_FULL_44_12b]|uniref:Glycosyl transferase family 1 domain-containing protein n=1 Tax=Candidatus Zambryskibacteria bacterium RIFCSPLOWO2_02_FULL_44_12b TaxID=1802772 RepID=A0A1G2UNK2_9BACT|nr:MAG: hypothetical protein A3H60_02005 [Candidatus Zambryskibacteria bacterium RIFCSPLOWO2_02_FULL_44_12b]